MVHRSTQMVRLSLVVWQMNNEELKQLSDLFNEFCDTIDEDIYYWGKPFL